MYKKEFNSLNQNSNISIIQENNFIEEIKNSKINDYYVYKNFNNYGDFNYNLKVKYINNYINFYNFFTGRKFSYGKFSK